MDERSRVKQPVLSEDELQAALAAPDGPGWELIGGKLVKLVTCDGFVGALAFVEEVGQLAEEANHHPDIDIRYNRVTLALVTHDSGGITQLDLDLARAIDGVVGRLSEASPELTGETSGDRSADRQVPEREPPVEVGFDHQVVGHQALELELLFGVRVARGRLGTKG